VTNLLVIAVDLAAVSSNNGDGIPPALWFAIAAVIVVIGVAMILRWRKS
jgi:hypothetical protein